MKKKHTELEMIFFCQIHIWQGIDSQNMQRTQNSESDKQMTQLKKWLEIWTQFSVEETEVAKK